MGNAITSCLPCFEDCQHGNYESVTMICDSSYGVGTCTRCKKRIDLMMSEFGCVESKRGMSSSGIR
jgi:hypothetical protein